MVLRFVVAVFSKLRLSATIGPSYHDQTPGCHMGNVRCQCGNTVEASIRIQPIEEQRKQGLQVRGYACSHADGPTPGARLDESVRRVRRPKRRKRAMAVKSKGGRLDGITGG